MQILNIRRDKKSLRNFLNLLLAIVNNLQVEGYMVDYDHILQRREWWDDSLSLVSIHLYDSTETFGIVLMPKMFLTSVQLFFYKTEDSVFINLSNPNWPLETAECFEEYTKYNLKINHKKCKVFSCRKCKSFWYAGGVKLNVMTYFMWLCIIFHINLSCKKQSKLKISATIGQLNLGENDIDAYFMIYQPKTVLQSLCLEKHNL